MDHGEIGRIARLPPRTQGSVGSGVPVPTRIHADRSVRGDVVELTQPNLAAMRLLRQRVLEHTRLALELPVNEARRMAFARIPAADPHEFLDRLLSDQNLLASARRGSWPAERVDAAVEQGLVDGTAETAEVLFELGDLDGGTWRLIASVLEEFYKILYDATPEPVRAALFGAGPLNRR